MTGILPRDTYTVTLRKQTWFEEAPTVIMTTWYTWTAVCNEMTAMAQHYNQIAWGGRTQRIAGGDEPTPHFQVEMAWPFPRRVPVDCQATAATRQPSGSRPWSASDFVPPAFLAASGRHTSRHSLPSTPHG